MDTQSAVLKAVASHTPFDGLQIHGKEQPKLTSGEPENHRRTRNSTKKFSTEEIRSKQKTNQQKLRLKTMYLGNIDENISEEDIHELFDLN